MGVAVKVFIAAVLTLDQLLILVWFTPVLKFYIFALLKMKSELIAAK
jgi:hypothetical protein